MAKKIKTATSNAKKNGVEKIIDYLNANKDSIGGIVVCVTRKPKAKIKHEDPDHESVDNNVLSADLMSGYDDVTNMRSPVCYGLAAIIKRVLG